MRKLLINLMSVKDRQYTEFLASTPCIEITMEDGARFHISHDQSGSGLRISSVNSTLVVSPEHSNVILLDANA